MGQPVPKKIKENNPNAGLRPYNTLLIDGSNVLELSMKDETVSSSGKQTGGISQFLLQIRMMLQKGNFRYVYVFWDGINSGQLRYSLNNQYKQNRDKEFEDEGLSDYMKEVNERVRQMQQHIFNKSKTKHKDAQKELSKKEHKDLFYWQRDVIMECLEELFIRQCVCDKTEADDFIGYYVTHKEPNERVVIMSNDRDLTQLISDDVTVYVQSLKQFVTHKNHKEIMGYDYRNVVLKKIICGDTSDNIKGIKGVGETTLFTNFPEVTQRKVELNEVIDKARKINETRVNEGKKPLKWAENIINSVTDGIQGEKIYEINRKIIDLSDPLMTDEAKELLDSMMHAPLDPEGRSMQNLYEVLINNGVDEYREPNRFAYFFSQFDGLINQEKQKSLREICIP